MKQTINREEFYNYTLTIQTPCRSQWDRGVEFYAHYLAEILNDDYLPGNIEVQNLCEILRNGADNWQQFAWGGNGLIYNEDIASTLLTPSQRERITQANTYGGLHLLDIEAIALTNAAARVDQWARRFSNKK